MSKSISGRYNPSRMKSGPQPGEEAAKRMAQLRSENAAFVRALLDARQTGTGSEREIVLGVVKDRRPVAIKRMQPHKTGSTSSSAGW
jgi:hypothetical protein